MEGGTGQFLTGDGWEKRGQCAYFHWPVPSLFCTYMPAKTVKLFFDLFLEISLSTRILLSSHQYVVKLFSQGVFIWGRSGSGSVIQDHSDHDTS